MKLVREAIKDNESQCHGNKHLFTIYDNNPELLEKVENAIRDMEDRFGDKWEDYCDCCPCYDDGYGSGFWIPIDMIEDFKKSWKIAKKIK